MKYTYKFIILFYLLNFNTLNLKSQDIFDRSKIVKSKDDTGLIEINKQRSLQKPDSTNSEKRESYVRAKYNGMIYEQVIFDESNKKVIKHITSPSDSLTIEKKEKAVYRISPN